MLRRPPRCGAAAAGLGTARAAGLTAGLTAGTAGLAAGLGTARAAGAGAARRPPRCTGVAARAAGLGTARAAGLATTRAAGLGTARAAGLGAARAAGLATARAAGLATARTAGLAAGFETAHEITKCAPVSIDAESSFRPCTLLATPVSRDRQGGRSLTKRGEEAGRGLLVGRVYATHGVLDDLGAVHKVEVDRRRISGHEGLAGPACACAAEGCHLPDFAGASAHAEADSTLAGGTGHHRSAGRECGRASCSGEDYSRAWSVLSAIKPVIFTKNAAEPRQEQPTEPTPMRALYSILYTRTFIAHASHANG